MARIPNASNYRNRPPSDRTRPSRRPHRSHHQPRNRHQARHPRHQPALSRAAKYTLFGTGVAVLIYLLWGGWGLFLALLILVAILFARHAWRL
ncbi:MAG: hypothetical protein VBE63_25845 [Lamprobacter sp.]|uniref:hypothetical protein n=1 Tax=Lamprobacter sp. TaxID=3100796 RepID=UPI002B25B4CE|nr:hypothetical protein [Lamprobacter sp.]MEA3643331.1 hypothetical protein [Lamprobacter sp.]